MCFTFRCVCAVCCSRCCASYTVSLSEPTEVLSSYLRYTVCSTRRLYAHKYTRYFTPKVTDYRCSEYLITPMVHREGSLGALWPRLHRAPHAVLTFRSGRSRPPPRVSPQPAPRSPPPPTPSAPTWRRGAGLPPRSPRRRPWRGVRHPGAPAVYTGSGVSGFGGGSLEQPRQWLGVQRPGLSRPQCRAAQRGAMRALRRRGGTELGRCQDGRLAPRLSAAVSSQLPSPLSRPSLPTSSPSGPESAEPPPARRGSRARTLPSGPLTPAKKGSPPLPRGAMTMRAHHRKHGPRGHTAERGGGWLHQEARAHARGRFALGRDSFGRGRRGGCVAGGGAGRVRDAIRLEAAEAAVLPVLARLVGVQIRVSMRSGAGAGASASASVSLSPGRSLWA